MLTRRIFTAAALLMALSALAFGEKRVSGVIERETRWKAEDGPYIIEGDLLIAKRGNLIIAPGTQIIIKTGGAKEAFLAPPFDRADSTLLSIRVQGAMSCAGRRSTPITITPDTVGLADFSWRGIIIDGADGSFTEIAFTEIVGAATAVTVNKSSPLIRNNIIENCNTGVLCIAGGEPKIYNNQITSCFAAGIKIERSNPIIANNIIAFNSNIGIFGDNKSKITVKYNCVFGNIDGNFLDCDPELGKTVKSKKNKDSTDTKNNLVTDPVFVGSPAEAKAIEIDITLQTDSSKVKDKKLLHIPKFDFSKPRLKESTVMGGENRQLSKYSPCVHTGDPGAAFQNVDGSRNTMGPTGGQDFFSK
jgi:hypothetical protein